MAKIANSSVLMWIERGLLITGSALGIWCAVTLVEARFVNSLPPPPRVVMTLPGDSGGSRTARTPARGRPGPPAPVPGSVIGKLEAPTLRLSTTVLEGSDAAVLSRGSGHIEYTARPGEQGNVGIAGHRDTVFRRLRHAKPGDPLTLTTRDHVYRYRITRTLIVNPDDVNVLDPTAEPTLTLVTCYPFYFIGHAPRRFIVQAELVKKEARATGASSPSP